MSYFLCACLSVDAVVAVYQDWEGINFQFIQFRKWIFCMVCIFSPRVGNKIGTVQKLLMQERGEKRGGLIFFLLMGGQFDFLGRVGEVHLIYLTSSVILF